MTFPLCFGLVWIWKHGAVTARDCIFGCQSSVTELPSREAWSCDRRVCVAAAAAARNSTGSWKTCTSVRAAAVGHVFKVSINFTYHETGLTSSDRKDHVYSRTGTLLLVPRQKNVEIWASGFSFRCQIQDIIEVYRPAWGVYLSLKDSLAHLRCLHTRAEHGLFHQWTCF